VVRDVSTPSLRASEARGCARVGATRVRAVAEKVKQRLAVLVPNRDRQHGCLYKAFF
jgi:hypothetical protein